MKAVYRHCCSGSVAAGITCTSCVLNGWWQCCSGTGSWRRSCCRSWRRPSTGSRTTCGGDGSVTCCECSWLTSFSCWLRTRCSGRGQWKSGPFQFHSIVTGGPVQPIFLYTVTSTPVILIQVHLPGAASFFLSQSQLLGQSLLLYFYSPPSPPCPPCTVICFSICVNVNKILKASLVAMLLYEHMKLLHALVGTVSTSLVAAVELTRYTSLNFPQGINEII